MIEYCHKISSQNVRPGNEQWLERHSPGDGKLLAKVALGTADDVNKAVVAARQAFDSGPWAGISGVERGKVISKLADLMEENQEELAQLEAQEAGKPISAARFEIGMSIGITRFAASLAWNLSGRLVSDAGPDKLGFVIQQARGVAGLIVSWNYPVVCLMHKLPYALAAGCSVVIKPSEFTPGSTLKIVELAEQAGVPSGQINVVLGTGEVVGEAMTSSPDIDMISFTGSSRVGKHIAAKCAKYLRHCTLELGGKGSNIIFADADLDRAVEATYQGFTFNKGEECCSCTKILVEKSIADEFSKRLVARCAQVNIGKPLDENTDMGPMIHEQQMERVLGFIERGKASGASLLVGGSRVVEKELADGYFLQPTLFTDVTPEMEIYKDEIFGPVACIVTFDTLDEAVKIANDTSYGLANGVWSESIDKALTAMRRLKSGMVYVNTYFETLTQLPLGGLKESGMGHEHGSEGLQEFMETRSAFVRIDTDV